MRNNKDFPNKNRRIWRKFLIYSGYSIPQITQAIRVIKTDEWDNLTTTTKISKIKNHLKKTKAPKITY